MLTWTGEIGRVCQRVAGGAKVAGFDIVIQTIDRAVRKIPVRGGHARRERKKARTAILSALAGAAANGQGGVRNPGGQPSVEGHSPGGA